MAAPVPARAGQLNGSIDNSRAVFERNGLGPPGFWAAAAVPGEETGQAAGAAALCDALEQLGGIYTAFARFLSWRADLLSAVYLSRLRRVRVDLPPVPAATVAEIIRRDLGRLGADLAASVGGDPLWNTLHRTAYRASWAGQPMVVEVARDPFPEEQFESFLAGLRFLRQPDLTQIVTPHILAQFGEWIRNGESLVRERSFLEVLGNYRGETLADYPRLIPELSSSAVLCWPAVEGRRVSQLIAHGDPGVAVKIASAVLEQFYSLSMIDADPDLDAMIIDADGRLHIRRLNNPIAVLPGVINQGIKYITAVLAGNAPLSAQHLIRLVHTQPPLDLEKQLMDEFSGVEPELKINRWFPPSAGAFESNWRALAKLAPARPMFLDFLQRNLVAVGYWNSDAVRAGGPPSDAIAEAQWPVVTRLLRTQFGLLLNRESAQEWIIGSGLLMFGTMREMNRLVEEVRENDVTLGVDLSDWRRAEAAARTVRYPVILGVLFLLFVVSLQLGGAAPQPWATVLKVLAAGAVPAMFWAISKIA